MTSRKFKFFPAFMTRFALSRNPLAPITIEQLARRPRSGIRRGLVSSLAILKQEMSRVRELMVWSGLILGPLKSGHTRVTWKTVRLVTWNLQQLLMEHNLETGPQVHQ
jgi:hypothetical protein